jgi:glyoxylase-like metal-dependent hydrolase (beta-lactamase superfamily II)
MEHERLEVPQPHYGGVNVYRIGDTLVDTGHVWTESRDQIRAALEDGVLAGVERVVLTHPHIDHVGGSMALPELADLPHVVPEGADDLVGSYSDYVRAAREEMGELRSVLDDGDETADAGDDLYFPLDLDYADDGVNVVRTVADGDTVRVGEYTCEAVHTPGHSQQHVALLDRDTGAMLSGDIVSTNGHFMYGPLHWDVGAYKRSLRRLRDLDVDRYLPGHGNPMTDPRARCVDAIEKAERVEEAVLAAVAEHGELAADELAREALGASEATVSFLTSVASAYAVHLASEGEIDVDRRPYVVARPA